MFGEFKLGKSFLKVQESKLHTPLKVVEFYAKGDLISESFSLWLKSPQKGANLRHCSSSPLLDSAEGRDLARFLEI